MQIGIAAPRRPLRRRQRQRQRRRGSAGCEMDELFDTKRKRTVRRLLRTIRTDIAFLALSCRCQLSVCAPGRLWL